MTQPQIQVMLVDDSAVIRGALTRILEADPAIKVVSSQMNGQMAVQAAERIKPHIIILDIEMPVMDGLTALPELLKVSPQSKVIMFSTLTSKGASVTMKALQLGAVECLLKPSSTQSVGVGSEFQLHISNLLKDLVPEGIRLRSDDCTARRPFSAPATPPATAPVSLHDDRFSYLGKPEIIAIGSSTGGPNALFEMLKHFKDFDVPMILTQHMPPTFTKILADHIQSNTGLITHEAADDMVLKAGELLLAPGGKHMKFERRGADTVVRLDDGPPVNFCKPAVDVMIDSALEIYGKKMLGVILTGMGADGLGGCKKLVEAGGRVVAQDEATSVVWGMPGAVAKAGICSKILPLGEIGPWVQQQMGLRAASASNTRSEVVS